MSRLIAVVFAGFVMAACSASAPLKLEGLDGDWEGRAVRSYGDNSCPSAVPYRMRIAAGNVRGEILHYRTPGLVIETFEAYIETDGEMIALARPFGEDTTIRGRFTTAAFAGETKSQSCTNRILLRPRRAN